MSATRWVLERKLLELTGLTKDAVPKLRSRYWIEGRHFRKAPNGRIWYNHGEIDRWVEEGEKAA